MKHDYIAAFDRRDVVNELVDEEPVMILEPREHAGAFNAHRLVEEEDDENRNARGDQQIAKPKTEAQARALLRRNRLRCCARHCSWGRKLGYSRSLNVCRHLSISNY